MSSAMYHPLPSKWPMSDYKSYHDPCPDYFYNIHNSLYHYNAYNKYNN